MEILDASDSLSAPAPAEAPRPDCVRITPWVDPVVDRRGHDPRSSYVERFWLGTLGPTATWLVRRLAAGFDRHPTGYLLDLGSTAHALGLSNGRGPTSAFARAFSRCIMFGLAHQRGDGYAVRRMLPDLARRHVVRMPQPLQQEHERWIEAARAHPLDELQRARSLAAAMRDLGDDEALIEHRLVAVGITEATAAEAVELLRVRAEGQRRSARPEHAGLRPAPGS